MSWSRLSSLIPTIKHSENLGSWVVRYEIGKEEIKIQCLPGKSKTAKKTIKHQKEDGKLSEQHSEDFLSVNSLATTVKYSRNLSTNKEKLHQKKPIKFHFWMLQKIRTNER